MAQPALVSGTVYGHCTVEKGLVVLVVKFAQVIPHLKALGSPFWINFMMCIMMFDVAVAIPYSQFWLYYPTFARTFFNCQSKYRIFAKSSCIEDKSYCFDEKQANFRAYHTHKFNFSVPCSREPKILHPTRRLISSPKYALGSACRRSSLALVLFRRQKSMTLPSKRRLHLILPI